MIQVDRALFSNAMSALSRTGNLPGGGVRGLPGGAVLGGLQGVSSFSSDIQDAQKDFEKGRVRSALERIRQIEAHFQNISSRWNSTATTIVSGARTGSQQISIQKLNEVKSAQAKMNQLTRPASKSLQDLVTALEHALTNLGRDDESAVSDDSDDDEALAASDAKKKEEQTAADAKNAASLAARDESSNTPNEDLLGQFAMNYVFGDKLKPTRRSDGKVGIEPALEENKFFFFSGAEPPRVFRIREVARNSIVVFDPHIAAESMMDEKELKLMLRNGIWKLEARKKR